MRLFSTLGKLMIESIGWKCFEFGKIGVKKFYRLGSSFIYSASHL